MQKTINDYIKNTSKNTGLLLADPPTGYGKTYMAAQSIYDYVKNSDENKKIFFATTLTKNLPVDELCKIYKKHDEEDSFEEDVLVIKSNYEFVYENLLDLEIPDEFRTTAYYELRNKLVSLNQLEKRKDSSLKEFIEDIKKQIRDKSEKAFRNDIYQIIKQKMPKNKAARIKMIRNNQKYQWIGKLYPTVFTDDYRVYMLTVSKLLVRNTTLVEPSYEFLKSDIMDGAIVFIDEFDATKDTIQSHIIKKAIDSQDDYIRLFEQIYKTVETHRFPNSMLRPYQEYKQDDDKGINFEALKKEAKEIYEQYHMNFSYKTTADSIERKQSFLFNDNSYHTMLRNNRNYIRVTPNEEENQVQIFFESKTEYDNNKSENDIVIYALIRAINRFLNKLRFLVFSWANYYMKSENEKRSELEDEFTIENAIHSIYREFSLTDAQVQTMIGDITGSSSYYKEGLIPDMSFYENGFKYFEFVDSDAHLGKTIFNHVQIMDTPEKIILFLAKKAKVIGLSATATWKTVVGNYDLNYLAKELGENYQLLSPAVKENIRKELTERWKMYETGQVKINLNVVDYNKGNINLEIRMKELFSDRDIAKKYSMEVMLRSGTSKYIGQRYCNIFEVIKIFMREKETRSFLCLNYVLPEYHRASFDLELFQNVAAEFAAEYQVDEFEFAVLKSDNFDIQKEVVLEKLARGKKIFIFSSYKTIGAGQNLQYDVPNNQEVVRIFEPEFENDSRIQKKDMDGIYLGDITHVIANAYDRENFGKAEMLDFFFEAEYLYQNDEIDFSILNRLIKQGFKSYSNSEENDREAIGKMRKCKGIGRCISRDVIQAIGRMGRTFNKNKEIHILTTEELLVKMDVDKLDDQILSPEMKCIVDYKEKMGTSNKPEENELQNRASRISTQGKGYIRRMLSRKWTPRSMELWQNLRECVLKYPTSACNNESCGNLIDTLYIDNKDRKSCYLFAQKGDFSDVVIDYDNDRAVLGEIIKDGEMTISYVNEEESRLEQILKYPGMRKHFEENGWATSFGNEEKILSPILFQNIYKGALGEAAGRFIFRKELGIQLTEISEPEKFEFFDYEIAEGVYVDFKHWKYGYPDERAKKLQEIKNKMDAIEAKKVFIVNIVADEQWGIQGTRESGIIEIPRLIDHEGKVDKKVIKYLKGELDEYLK